MNESQTVLLDSTLTVTSTPRMTSGRLFFIGAVLFIAASVLFLCEQQGFRVIDDSMWGIHSKESGFLSLPEMLVVFSVIGLGIIGGIVALISSVIWLVQHFRHASNDNDRNA